MSGETKLLYLEDSYLKECEAKVIDIFENNDFKAIALDQTVFYPGGGGQPPDIGKLYFQGKEFEIKECYKRDGKVWHVVDKGIEIKEGDKVKVSLDWNYRYRIMRMHTSAHLLSAIIHEKEGALITGNQLGYEKSRIDFNLESFDKEKIKEIVEEANRLIQKGAEVKHYYLPREEVEKMPELSKLAKGLPAGLKVLRIVEIEGIDKQADGGTHVKNTKEISKIILLKTENKGKNNRRLYFTLE